MNKERKEETYIASQLDRGAVTVRPINHIQLKRTLIIQQISTNLMNSKLS